MQSNQVYTDLFVVWRSVYMHYSKTDNDFRQIQNHIESIEFQFNRWTVRDGYNSTLAHFIFKAPRQIISQLIRMGCILRKYAKKQSNTSMVYQLDSKITYLNFLELQYKDFYKYTKIESNVTKVINLPILKIVASQLRVLPKTNEMNKLTPIESLKQQKLILAELISVQLVRSLQIKDFPTTDGLQRAMKINNDLIKSLGHED